MFEASETKHHALDENNLIEETTEGALCAGLFKERSAIMSRWQTRLEYGYPTPFDGRDAWLHEVHDLLRPLDIWSRGRFGGWKYEVSNQDHALMQGVEIVDHLVHGTSELTYPSPDTANSRYHKSRRVDVERIRRLSARK